MNLRWIYIYRVFIKFVATLCIIEITANMKNAKARLTRKLPQVSREE